MQYGADKKTAVPLYVQRFFTIFQRIWVSDFCDQSSKQLCYLFWRKNYTPRFLGKLQKSVWQKKARCFLTCSALCQPLYSTTTWKLSNNLFKEWEIPIITDGQKDILLELLVGAKNPIIHHLSILVLVLWVLVGLYPTQVHHGGEQHEAGHA